MHRSPTDFILQASSSWEITAVEAAINIELYDTAGLNPVAFATVALGATETIDLPAATGLAPLFGSRKLKLTGDSEFRVKRSTNNGEAVMTPTSGLTGNFMEDGDGKLKYLNGLGEVDQITK